MSYPVSFEVDYRERRSRVTVFFRLLLALPLAIWLYLYGLLTGLALILAWLSIVLTGRYPRALYDLVAGFNRCLARVTAYAALLCDPYPPFGPSDDADYPVRVSFAGPLARYSRLKGLFRFILAIPVMILRYVMSVLLQIGAFAAWFVVLVLGRMPRGLFDLMVLANSYMARSDAYLLLLTETYPPFQDEHTRAAGASGA